MQKLAMFKEKVQRQRERLLSIPMPDKTVMQCGVAAISTVFITSWLRIRPLGIFFLILFGVWFYRTRCTLRIVAPPELQKKLEQLTQHLRDWRMRQPKMFCIITSGFLAMLAIAGHILSDSTVVICGLVLAGILSTKYNFKLVKIEAKDFDWIDRYNHDVELDTEFMPEVNERTSHLLDRASDLASLTQPTEGIDLDDEEKSDEIPSELLLEDNIPDIDENSTDEEDDLLPAVNATASTALQSENSNQIAFKKGHFKRDSSLSTSSSSEESLSKGLQFPDHTTVDAASIPLTTSTNSMSSSSSSMRARQNKDASEVMKLQAMSLISTSSKLLPAFMTGLMQWGSTAPTTSREETEQISTQIPTIEDYDDISDGSDFEVVDKEDFK